MKLKEWYTGFTLSLRLSLCPFVCGWKLYPLCIFHNISEIHFTLTYLINQLQKMCCVLSFFFLNPKFEFLAIFFLASGCFWPCHGIVYIFHQGGGYLRLLCLCSQHLIRSEKGENRLEKGGNRKKWDHIVSFCSFPSLICVYLAFHFCFSNLF